jgi:hypothetical protein
MEIKNERIYFAPNEADEIKEALEPRRRLIEYVDLDHMTSVSEATIEQSRALVRELHAVATYTEYPENIREEAANQLMRLALVGLRSSSTQHHWVEHRV